MAFREVSVVVVREILRLWLCGHGYRSIGRLARVDPKTARRYLKAAVAAGLDRERGEHQLTEELLAAVVAAVPSGRPPGDRGGSWRILLEHKAFITERLDKGLTVVRIERDLARHKGVEVPSRTLYRFCEVECGTAAKRTTVRLDDPEPGTELQVDFGRMGLLYDPDTGRRRVCHALVFTAAFSRHTFVWPTFSQALEAVIEGFEAAWAFFGGVFKVVIPDNCKAIVDKSDPLSPRLNEAFLEYAQARGFLIDAARVRHPKDKARVERAIGYVRRSFFAGEEFRDLSDARRRAERWCRTTAGLRIHGTTARRTGKLRNRRPMIFTTNKPLSAWGRVLHDPDLAEAILDRILERGRHLDLPGPSYRTKHLKLDLSQPAGPRSAPPTRICLRPRHRRGGTGSSAGEGGSDRPLRLGEEAGRGCSRSPRREGRTGGRCGCAPPRHQEERAWRRHRRSAAVHEP